MTLSFSLPTRRASCTFAIGIAFACAGVAGAAHASIVPNRTRVIFNEGEPAAVVTLTNNGAIPYLVQSWIEDPHGRRITSPLMAVPPLQRIDPSERTVLRIARLPGGDLPADRESVFYLNVREIPPKTDTPNTLQIALHTQMKLFWRPKGVQPARGEDPTLPMTVRVDAPAHRLVFDNPTPYHVTIVGLKTGAHATPLSFDPVMVDPMSRADAPFGGGAPASLFVTHVDDYGGQITVEYACSADECRSAKR
ncbi:fimbrial biogenesis chaperone [Burkholderia guangdongensis]|uniref:fimbrial biogenesis chaperone n=1 Tax=Burkholderia guangdongensis TaxID=1792500 RepID=UPI0015CD4364|nr:molecular chaperone [Burkholderia guangdongensis]